jgi:hypothetical protein
MFPSHSLFVISFLPRKPPCQDLNRSLIFSRLFHISRVQICTSLTSEDLRNSLHIYRVQIHPSRLLSSETSFTSVEFRDIPDIWRHLLTSTEFRHIHYICRVQTRPSHLQSSDTSFTSVEFRDVPHIWRHLLHIHRVQIHHS